MKHLLLVLALSLSFSVLAQTAPAYEFLTVAAAESGSSKLSQITFAPSFQGKTQVQLEEISASFEKMILAHQHNLATVNLQLEAITVVGWELVHVFGTETSGLHEREYLFRRRKP
jgi:hypothetical protein